MAVLVVSGDTPSYDHVLCVICFQKVPLTDVTAGSLYASGHQAFACNDHLHDRTRWITEWSTFDTRQQEQKQLHEITEAIC